MYVRFVRLSSVLYIQNQVFISLCCSAGRRGTLLTKMTNSINIRSYNLQVKEVTACHYTQKWMNLELLVRSTSRRTLSDSSGNGSTAWCFNADRIQSAYACSPKKVTLVNSVPRFHTDEYEESLLSRVMTKYCGTSSADWHFQEQGIQAKVQLEFVTLANSVCLPFISILYRYCFLNLFIVMKFLCFGSV